MAFTASAKPMTTVELLATPDDGVERWLIKGELREAGPMTKRNLDHSSIMAQISYCLIAWAKESKAQGKVVCGGAGFRLARNQDSVCEIDVAYISPKTLHAQPVKHRIIEGAPALAVEILSGSDTREQIDEKVDLYLAADVKLVWIVNPHDRSVLAYRPDRKPQYFDTDSGIDGEPHLPGFRVPVSRIFE